MASQTEYQQGLAAIQRRRAIADAMQAQAMSPLNAPLSGTGNYPIQTKISPLQVIAQLGQAFVAKKQHDKADKDYSKLAEAMASDRSKALAALQVPQDMAPATSSDEGPTHAPMGSRAPDPATMQAAIDAGIDPSIISNINKSNTPVVLGDGSQLVNPGSGAVIAGRQKTDYKPQELSATAARDAETQRHNRASETVATTNAANKGKAFFGDDEKDLMGALAERGVALPAGLRSKDQMKSTFRGLLDRNPDLTSEQIADKVASGQINFGADKGTMAAAKKDFATGKSGQMLRSIGTANKHLTMLDGMVDALNNGDMQLVNKVGNAWAKQTGQAAPNSFDAVKQIVGQEVVKAIIAGGGGVHEREEAGSVINTAGSPKQLKDVIAKYRQIMDAQRESLIQQHRSIGLPDSDLADYDEGANGAAGAPMELPAKNDKGWVLHQDANGNKAYVGPNNEVEEVQ